MSNIKLKTKMKIMKKIMLSMSLMLAALALTNCTTDLEESVNVNPAGEGVTITVNAESRATLADNHLTWTEGDQIVFNGIEENYTGSYTTTQLWPYTFVTDSGNRFYNSSQKAYSGNYQFYAVGLTNVASNKNLTVYNTKHGTESLHHVTNNSDGNVYYFNVGYNVNQNGNNNAHVPSVSPMCWASDGYVAFEDVNVTLHHTTALMEFKVVNDADAPLTITAFSFAVPEGKKIAGQYRLNVKEAALVEDSDKTYLNAATVNVADAPTLAKGESMSVYTSVAPFSLTTGDKVTFTVYSDAGSAEIEKTVSRDVTFAKGTVNEQTVNVPALSAPKHYTVSELLAEIKENPAIVLKSATLEAKLTAIETGTAGNLAIGTLILSDIENEGKPGSGIQVQSQKFTDSLIVDRKKAQGSRLYDGVKVGAEIYKIKLDNLTGLTPDSYSGVLRLGGLALEDIDLNDDISESDVKITDLTAEQYLANAEGYTNVWVRIANVKPTAASLGALVASELKFSDATATDKVFTVYNNSRWADVKDMHVADRTGTITGVGAWHKAGQIMPLEVAGISDFFDPCLLSREGLVFSATDTAAQVIEAVVLTDFSIGTLSCDQTWVHAEKVEGGISISVDAYTDETQPREAVVSVPVLNKENVEVMVKEISVKQTQAGLVVTTVTDVLTSSKFAATSTSYTDFTGVVFTSTAVYAGNSGKANATNGGGIQLRSSNSNSGIVTTASGGKVRKIVVVWANATTNGRTLDIYGKDTAYTAATDLYKSESQGTKLGSIVKGTSTELEITDDYAYIGLRSKSNAMYIDSISITYEN